MDKKIVDQVYAELVKWEREVDDHNNAIIDGLNAQDDFKELIELCRITDKIEFVTEPCGTHQIESYVSFHQVRVDQWSTGTEGDTFSGHIYAQIHDGRWLKIPYEC